jgi:hypothetical protein
MFRFGFVLFISALLAGCGGAANDGGDSGLLSEPTRQLLLVKPTYNGSVEIAKIPSSEASKLIYELFYNLDLLNTFSFFGEYNSFLIFDDNYQASRAVTDDDCSAGSLTTQEFPSEKIIEATYNNCVIDGLLINGTLALKVVGAITETMPELNVVPELEFTLVGSDETLSISGYIQVRAGSNNEEAQATYQIVFSNSDGEQIYFDDFTVSSSFWADDYGLSYNGNVYYSELGKLSFSTVTRKSDADYGLVLEVIANQTIYVDVLLQDFMTIMFDNLTLPFNASLASLPESLYADINQAPIAQITSDRSNTERQKAMVLSALSSNDPNYDVLNFEWQLASGPTGANFQLSQSPQTEFISDLPGTYVLQLQVSDSKGGLDTALFEVYVEQSIPIAELNKITNIVEVNQTYQAQLNVLNDQYDGPIQILLAYGPENMTISADGEINWYISVPDFGKSLDVNFGVYLSNTDKQVVIPYSVQVNSAANSLVSSYSSNLVEVLNLFSPLASKIQTQYISPDKQGLALYIGESIAPDYAKHILQFYLDDTNVVRAEWLNLLINDQGSLELKHDINGDGSIDYLYKRLAQQESERRWEIWLVDGDSQQSTLVMSFDDYNAPDRMQVVKYGIDNRDVLVLYRDSTLRQPDIYDLPSFELLYDPQSFEETQGFCDFNQDGELDMVNGTGIISLLDDTNIVDFIDNYRNAYVIQGVEHCFVIGSNFGSETLYKWQNSQVVQQNINLGSTVLIGNFDGLGGQELISAAPNVDSDFRPQWQLHTFDSNGNPSSTILTQADNVLVDIWNRSSALGGVLGVVDLDGDGRDEIVVYVDEANTFGLPTGVAAIAVVNDELQQVYAGVTEPIPAGINKIVDLSEDGELITYNSRNVAIYNASGTQLLNDDGFNYQTLLHAETAEGKISYYTTGNNSIGINKYDGNGNLIWQSESKLSTVHVNDFKVVNDVVYFSTYGESLFIDANSGETLQQRNIDAQISVFPTSDLFFDHGLQKLREVSGNGLIVNWLSNDAGTFWDGRTIAVGKIGTIQYDDDPQAEFIVEYEESNINKIGVFDGLTGLPEIMRAWHSDESPWSWYYYGRKLNHCPNDEPLCRNLLIAEKNVIYNKDKLTGHTIWQSPYFVSEVYDAKITRTENHTKLAITSGFGIHIFE